jgi:rhodanese-related sulfurtransferase
MPLKNLLIVALLVLTVGGAVLGGCTTASQEPPSNEVPLEQLFAEPEHYAGEDVTIEGFYFSGFELNVLAEELRYSGLYQGHIVPDGRMIWIEGSLDTAVLDSLYRQPETNPTETFGKIRIEGNFEYGGDYGHLGSYIYQITPVATSVLTWSPDELGPPPAAYTAILETITPQAAFDLIEANRDNPDFAIIDVRGAAEFAQEHIENAINIDSAAEDFTTQLEALDKNGVYLVYCFSACISAADASATMVGLGFTKVYNMLGGIDQWKAAGFPTVTPES